MRDICTKDSASSNSELSPGDFVWKMVIMKTYVHTIRNCKHYLSFLFTLIVLLVIVEIRELLVNGPLTPSLGSIWGYIMEIDVKKVVELKALDRIYLILALGCLLYSAVVFHANSGTFSFIIWLSGFVFFLFLFFMNYKNIWPKVPILVTRIFQALVAVGIVVFLICQGCIFSQFFSTGKSDLDYIIVLGAQMRSFGPSVVYKARLDAAISYLEENPDTICIVTGGQGHNEGISEGEGGRDYLVEHGISSERIVVENTSLDTKENIENACEIIDSLSDGSNDISVGIVTNNFHVFRGIHLTKKTADYEIYGIAAFTEYLYLPNNLVRETFGILKDI